MKKTSKLIIIVLFFSIVDFSRGGDFGMDYIKGNDNFYNLSGFNLLLKLQSKSKLLSSEGNVQKATRSVKNIHMQITRKEGTTNNGEFKILNILNTTEVEK